MSAFIAFAPCMITQGTRDYDTYIATDWQAIENNVYPNGLGENYDNAGYCAATNNGFSC